MRTPIEDQIVAGRRQLTGGDLIEGGGKMWRETAGGAKLFDLERARRSQQNRQQQNVDVSMGHRSPMNM